MEKLKLYILAQLGNHLTKESSVSIMSILYEDIPNIDTLSKEEIDKIINRIINGEPTQYVTGLAPFYGYFFNVDKNVLIPRPETEELVYTVEKYIKQKGFVSPSILDIGTGSGCIPISINKIFPTARVTGLDVSTGALKIANMNNTNLKTKVAFRNIDFLEEALWDEIGQFDIIISNPPYIPKNEKALMTAIVLDNEPHLALFVEDSDPLLFYRKIFQFVLGQSEDTAIFLECNEFNALEVVSLFRQSFESEIIKDLQGKDRIVKAIRKFSK